MRQLDETPLDPELAAELDAIDATLAGDPVDPRHAELAELAVLLAADRPRPPERFGAALDERVTRRFAPARSDRAARRGRGRTALRGWYLSFAATAAAAAVAAVVVVAVLGSGGRPASPPAASGGSNSGGRASAGASSAASLPHRTASTGGSPKALRPAAAPGGQPLLLGPAVTSAASGAAAPAPAPVPNGRKIIQSAQVALSARPDRIATVAQEVFDVVGRENGVVNSSNVTSGSGGYAEFQLSVPSSSLAPTMTALSELRDASVVSRTDSTQDVNGEFLYDTRKLADDRALRTSLLKQLQNAVTQQQVASLTAQIRDAEASIRSDEATLRRLTHSIDFSQIVVTVNAASAPVSSHHSGTFTLGRAWHDAGRVLMVAAGVGLIAIAALIPVGLLAALAWWIGSALRRRRREHALDLA